MARTRKSNWDRDDYQFPRLIDEIIALGISEKKWAKLMISMDLSNQELESLFDRAVTAWDRIKAEVGPTKAKETK